MTRRFVNGVTAALFASGRKGDLNIRGAFLHMIADAAVSAGVVVAALAILYTGWFWLDPLASLVIVGIIVWTTWSLLRDSLAMSVGAVPPSIDPQAVRSYLSSCTGVSAVHDLHIWPLSTTENALTASRLSRRPSRGRLPAGGGDRAAAALRHRPRAFADRDQRGHRLPPRARSCRVRRRPDAAIRATADRCQQFRLSRIRVKSVLHSISSLPSIWVACSATAVQLA